MIIVIYTCTYCGVHCQDSYDIDIKAKRVFINCGNCGALLELGKTEREKKGGKNER